MAEAELELTGERTLPGISQENYWFTRHLVTYQFAQSISQGKRVIDLGCGEGYGSSLLAETADEVVGVDIDPKVIEHARNTYPKENLSFAVMNIYEARDDLGKFDLAVCFQVVEHLWDDSFCIEELKKLLESPSKVIISTPNRLTISPGENSPINPFHYREYSPPEFAEFIGKHFDEFEMFGLYHAGWLKLNEAVPLVDFINFYSMSALNPRYWAHRLLTPRIKTSNFRIRKGADLNCLDMISVCEKS